MFDALSHTLYHPSTIAHTAVELLDRVRATTPLVHCLTNSVVTGFTANALLAVGATPAMVDLPGEAGPFASVADAILINLGTLHAAHRDAMLEAVQVARTHGTPWVLDPVAVGILPIRTALADQLRGEHPTAIRGNASEIMALAGAGSGGEAPTPRIVWRTHNTRPALLPTVLVVLSPCLVPLISLQTVTAIFI